MVCVPQIPSSFILFAQAPGCKRIIVDPEYLKSLHRSNVELEWNAIQSIEGNGIKLKNGEMVPLDVIIFSTGYSIVSSF